MTDAADRMRAWAGDLFQDALSAHGSTQSRVAVVEDRLRLILAEHAASERAEGFRQGMKDAVKIAKDFAQVSQGPGISTGLAIAAECNRRALLPEPPQGGTEKP